MKTMSTTIRVLTCAVFILGLSSLAQAQATRTWVSGVGDDANPCSRTAPCKTFAGAISKTADGGEISVLDPGGYGAVTITKGITIDGAGTLASILASGTNGVIVNATNTKDIRLRNISINGAGTTLGLNAIRFLNGQTLHIENVEIAGFSNHGIDVALTGAAPTGGFQLNVHNVNISRLTGATSMGVKLSSTNSFLLATLNNVRAVRLPTGLQVGNQSFALVQNSMFTGGGIGIDMLNNATGGPRATIESSNLGGNTTGLRSGTGTFAFLSQTSITQNSTGILAQGGTVQSSGNNPILSNTSDGLTPTIIPPK